MTGTTWTQTHAEFEERLAESNRTGCDGTFEVIDNDGKRPATVQCSRCGYLRGVTQAVLAGGTTPVQTGLAAAAAEPDIPFRHDGFPTRDERRAHSSR